MHCVSQLIDDVKRYMCINVFIPRPNIIAEWWGMGCRGCGLCMCVDWGVCGWGGLGLLLWAFARHAGDPEFDISVIAVILLEYYLKLRKFIPTHVSLSSSSTVSCCLWHDYIDALIIDRSRVTARTLRSTETNHDRGSEATQARPACIDFFISTMKRVHPVTTASVD